ncbi:orphan sodium- and chloride-dependent neurotransmitter transporter NTT5 isoform X2 [Canis lupus baileyi]|uniref:orphan sodium- and chloride-dependent neurotransmitter transporter NTT5 isoform X2 n=1 Tax=Canis lupus dingo TaxID=286419 RepID=UPI0020C34AC4|nr:orphan sodium- and chloride-dependent neurotransmitter transporter NTT5 isoform X2 [Canis lupus dingo]
MRRGRRERLRRRRALSESRAGLTRPERACSRNRELELYENQKCFLLFLRFLAHSIVEHLKSQQKVRVAEAQRTERSVTPDMSSTQEGEHPLERAGAAPESLPGMETEAQASKSSLTNLSTEIEFSENLHEIKSWEDKSTANWHQMLRVSESQAFKARVLKAQAWEIQASEAHRRASQTRHTSVLEMDATQALKQKPLPEKVQATEKEKCEILFTRPCWSNKIEYILTQVGYSMKISSLWHFFILWLHNGGCSFLIIYILMLFLVGVPLLFLEMAAGQRIRQSSIGVWKVISAWIGGVGYTSFMVCFITGLYLNVINVWTLFYLSQSFQFPVPWEKCPLLENSSDFDPECARTTPSLYFWYRLTLKASDRIEDGGSPVFSLNLFLLVSWCLIGAFMINGLKSTGKIMLVLVPAPYFIILCFLFRSLLLEGAAFGFQHLMLVKISAMYNMNVWCQAGNQVLFALGLGLGPVVSLSSHMYPSTNCLSDALIVALVNLFTMLLVTSFSFCVLGFWATVITHRCSEKNAETLVKLVAMGKLPLEAQPPPNLTANPTSVFNSWLNSLPQPIKHMVFGYVTECNLEKQFLKVKEGPSFAFVAFIETMSFIPGSVFWSILFFLLLLILGLISMIGIMQGILIPFQNTFSSFRKSTKLLTDPMFPPVVVFGFMFLCDLFFTRPSGIYYIRLLSEYWIVLPIIITIILENMAVGWAYGARRFLEDLAIVWGSPASAIIRWLWCFLCPIVLVALFVITLIHLSLKSITYVAWDSSSSKEVLRQYPSWALLVMIALFLIVILPIPTYFVYCLAHRISFTSTSQGKPIISFKSLPLIQPKPSKEVHKEETL